MNFDANEKLLKFSEKLNTVSGKRRVNMVTCSFLPFAVNAILNVSIIIIIIIIIISINSYRVSHMPKFHMIPCNSLGYE